MTVRLTTEGTRANQIMAWAYQDLPGRLDQARQQVGAMWEGADTDEARNEIGDVATQLSRLASGNVTMPTGTVSITGQLR